MDTQVEKGVQVAGNTLELRGKAGPEAIQELREYLKKKKKRMEEFQYDWNLQAPEFYKNFPGDYNVQSAKPRTKGMRT